MSGHGAQPPTTGPFQAQPLPPAQLYAAKIQELQRRIVELGEMLGDAALEGKITEVVVVFLGPQVFGYDTATIHPSSALGMMEKGVQLLKEGGLGGRAKDSG